jgi:hypothetical protein
LRLELACEECKEVTVKLVYGYTSTSHAEKGSKEASLPSTIAEFYGDPKPQADDLFTQNEAQAQRVASYQKHPAVTRHQLGRSAQMLANPIPGSGPSDMSMIPFLPEPDSSST